MRALLDVNVLIALLDANHVHHARARQWLEANIAAGWASCAVTQKDCLRVLSSTHYPNAVKPTEAAARLREATEQLFHQFWAGGPSVLSPGLVSWEYIVGSRQVTDAYLLGLAVHHGGRFVTFEQSLTPGMLRGAQPQHLVVL